MPCLSIDVLGPLQVSLNGQPLTGFKYNKVRALLAYLAVEAGRPHTRAHLSTLLWPDMPEATARRNLTQALSALRRILGEEAEAGRPWLLATSESVQLNPETDLEVDAARFTALLNAAERHPHRLWRTCSPCEGRLREAVGLYRGEFLSQLFVEDSEPFEEWALLWREQLRQRALTALERLARRAEWSGRFGDAVALVRQQVEIDSLREAAQRDLMRLLALDSQDAAAEAQYDAVRRLLATELAVEPDPATTAVYEHIRAGRLQPLRRLAAPPFNGPTPPTGLIGRQDDLEAVCGHLREVDIRLVTLTGTPGIGKTRLALAAAYTLRFDFEDGVHVVELAPAADASLVAPAIAQALGVKEQPGRPLAETLAAHLKDQNALLLLDNFEHVLDAAPLAADLLAAAPGLKLLVTSRAPLRIRAEQPVPLGPLASDDAALLFSERARAALPAFALTAENAEAIAALCAQVDNLPLAIELIAVRARALSLAELRRHLDRPLDALSHGARDLPERHRTLRNALRWSFDRLSPTEQQVFAHLGLFAGGCTVEAAQAVVGAETDALAALEALSDASLVQGHTAADAMRFTLLEVVREFALETLTAAGVLEAARRRHAAYFTALAEQAQAALNGPDQQHWVARLDTELPNLRAALRWCLAHDRDLGLRLAAAPDEFWSIRGHMVEGRRWLRDLLAQTAPASPLALARATRLAGWLAIRQGDAPQAQALGEAARRLFTELENDRGLSASVYILGEAAAQQSDFTEAHALFEASLRLARAAGDTYAEAAALNGLGGVVMRQGLMVEARRYQEARLAIFQAHQDARNTAGALHNLGVTAYESADYDAACDYGTRSLAALRELGDQYGLTVSLLHLGNTRLALGDLAGAQAHLEEAIAIHRRLHSQEPMAAPLNVLGKVLLARGDLAGARARSSEALRLRVEAGDRRGISVTLRALAAVDHACGQSERAAQLLGAVDAIRERIGARLPPNAIPEQEAFEAALLAALGPQAYPAAYAAGRALTQEAAVALALA